MRALYPEITPLSDDVLTVSGEHKIYFEECGNRNGIPVIFLHGGPGSGCNENHRRYFDPDMYRIIIFDQRGCNRSLPRGCVEQNTTQDLLQDMEAIRKKLEIDKWMVFGGSWGATLGLAYAEAFPIRVNGMILRGCFLARRQDLDWFAREGVNQIFPDYWQEFISVIPAGERHELIDAFHQRVFGMDDKARIQCARAWSEWAGKVVSYNLEAGNNGGTDKKEEAMNPTRESQKIVNEVSIELHYAKNGYFLEENQLLNNIDSLPEVPVKIIHGRRDLTCTLQSSWKLHQAVPKSELVIVPDAGHLAGEPAMINALITATDEMANLLK